MKFAFPLAALALSAVPASAEVVQRTTVTHNGKSVAVSYEPAIESSFRQTNLGPRSNLTCRWTSKVSVHRTAVDAEGRAIAALQRVVTGERTRSGQHLGPCTAATEQEKLRLAGGEEALRSQLAAAASADAARLRTELASLELLSGGGSYAR